MSSDEGKVGFDERGFDRARRDLYGPGGLNGHLGGIDGKSLKIVQKILQTSNLSFPAPKSTATARYTPNVTIIALVISVYNGYCWRIVRNQTSITGHLRHGTHGPKSTTSRAIKIPSSRCTDTKVS